MKLPPSHRPIAHLEQTRSAGLAVPDELAGRLIIRRRAPSARESVARDTLVKAKLLRLHLAEAALTFTGEDVASFARLADDRSVMHVVTDGYGKVLEGNEVACALLQVDRWTLPGRRLLNFIVREWRTPFFAAMARLRDQGTAVSDMRVAIRPLKDRSVVPVVFSALPKRDARRRLVAIHWFVRHDRTDGTESVSARGAGEQYD